MSAKACCQRAASQYEREQLRWTNEITSYEPLEEFSFSAPTFLLGGCGENSGVVASSLQEEDGGRSRIMVAPGATIEPQRLSPELAAQLLSNEPIPPPIPFGTADTTAPDDQRSAYFRWLDVARPAHLIVRVIEIEPFVHGWLASSVVLRSSAGGEGSRRVFALPLGMSCAGIDDVRVGEKILIHVAATDVANPTVAVVRVATSPRPMVARAFLESDGTYNVRFPWGDDSFATLVQRE